MTADRRIVLARRNAATPYSPGTWSATFEEQLTTTDIRTADAVEAATRRGVAEELGSGVRVVSVRPLSLVVEMPILNTSPVLLVTVAERMGDLRDAAAANTHDGELTDLTDINADPDAISDHLLNRDPATFHPTAALRLRILNRWFRQSKR